jgi:hypothetical protein
MFLGIGLKSFGASMDTLPFKASTFINSSEKELALKQSSNASMLKILIIYSLIKWNGSVKWIKRYPVESKVTCGYNDIH